MRENKPSRTAYKVALNIVVLGSKPGMETVLPPGIVEATEKMLLASGAATERDVQWAHSSRMVAVYEWFNWLLPGQFEAFAHRKAFCEQQTREGIASGAAQVLVLGAGYDTMGWRLAPEFPNVKFVEIEHPATANLKAKAFETMGKPENLTLISEDLGEKKLVDVLEANSIWNPEEQTVVIAEGLLMYLTPEAVQELFQQGNSVTGPGSRIVFTYVPTRNDGRPDAGPWTGTMLWILKSEGEPWLWSASPDELKALLQETGWHLNGPTRKQGVEFLAMALK